MPSAKMGKVLSSLFVVSATRLNQLDSDYEMLQIHDQVYLDSSTESEAQWGFLKNIVNIDTFFAGGHQDSESAHLG